MSLTLFKGDVPWWQDRLVEVGGVPAFGTSGLLDATAEKLAFIGCVWHPTVRSGTINIRKVYFRTGAVTLNVLSTFRVSLQNVSLTAGPPYQPDGTQDQTTDFVTAGLTANTMLNGTLSADRAVDLSLSNPGDAGGRWLAVVFEFATFTALDSVVISTVAQMLSTGASTANTLIGGNAVLNTGSYAALSGACPVVAFECDDGTFAFMDGGFPISAFSSDTVSSSGAIRAAGVKFRFPTELKISGAGLMLTVQNGADGTLTLYDSDGTTVLTSTVIDNDAVFSTAARMARTQFLDYTLAANTYYRYAFVATTTTSTTVSYCDVSAAGLMDGLVMGQDAHYCTRDSGGTWTDTTTRRPLVALKVSSVHDGAGGGGGLAMPVSGRIIA